MRAQGRVCRSYRTPKAVVLLPQHRNRVVCSLQLAGMLVSLSHVLLSSMLFS
jgi:hypothetical protein